MDLLGSERCMPKQAFAQMSKVSIRVSRRCDALVNLHHVYAFPGHLFVCQSTQHLPRRVATTDRHDETAARRDSRSSLRSDDLGSLTRHRISIGKYLNLHGSAPIIENGEWRTEDRLPLSSIFDTRSVSRSLPDSPSLRAVQLFGSLHSVPTYRARTRRPECLLLAPGQRCARPLPHSPRGQTRWRLLPWRHPAPVRKRPSPRHRDGGWRATLQVGRSSSPPGPSPSDQRQP